MVKFSTDLREINANLHDIYAAEYDQQVQSYGCHIADVLFGLCYAFIEPGQQLLDAGYPPIIAVSGMAETALR